MVTEKDPVCTLGAWPTAPRLTEVNRPFCPPDYACFYIQETLDLGVWIRDVERIHEDLTHCKTVVWSPE